MNIKTFFILSILAVILIHSCVTVQKAKTAADAFERKQYFVSASLYEKEFETNTNTAYKAKLAYGAAISYKLINETDQAVKWFNEAASLDFGDQAWRELGLAQIQQGQYDAAIQTYETVLNKKGNSEEFRLLLSTAKQARVQAKENLNIYKINSLPINTPAAEYSPCLDFKGNLIFTSDRPGLSATDVYKWTGRGYSDLYSSSKPETGEVSFFSSEINTISNEGTSCFNQAGNVLLFTRCGLTTGTTDGYCKIYLSVLDGGKWSAGQVLSFQKEGINYIHPCFAVHDSVIFFASDDSKGEGGFDIYYSERTKDNWGNPEHLGRRINTSSNEKFPFMYYDTLYFASDRLGGLGGLDIYKSFVNAEGEWQPPINLKAPINSNEDDFGLVIDPSSSASIMKGYFSSSRSGGAGKDDIYGFERTQTEESVLAYNKPKKDTVVAKKNIRYQVFMAVKVVQTIHENADDPNSKIVDKKPLPNALVLIKEGDKPYQLQTNTSGNTIQEINYDQNYFVIATYPGLLNSSKTVSTMDIKDPLNPVRTVNVEIQLDKAYTGKEVIIADIFYDLDKWFIRKDAEPSLNQLTQLLKDNPKIKIQLSSHTDCQGKDDYNLDLSNKRARSAVEYLVHSGIPENRLRSKGFGETQLIKKCICEQCTEEEHQANRRTTFTILE